MTGTYSSMLKMTALVAVFAVGMPYAHARTSCYQLLTNNVTPGEISEVELAAASTWLEDHPMLTPPAEPNRFVLQQWDRWRMVNEAQRDAALGVELRKLSRSVDGNVLDFSGDAQLTRLSAANRDRLIAQLGEKFPIARTAAADVAAQAKQMADEFRANWLRPVHLSKTGINAPLASPAELRRMTVMTDLSFYSHLVGGSVGVSFDLMATAGLNSPENLNATLVDDHVRLTDAFARENGYVLPKAQRGLELIRFMAKWDPAALDDQLRYSRYSFPEDVRTGEDLVLHLSSNNTIDEVFPPEAAYQLATPLRLHLKRFIMTEADAMLFLRAAFERFLLDQAQTPAEFRAIAAEWKKPAGAQRVLASKFLPYLGWPGMTLRVPISVPPQEYTIIRKDMTGGVPTALPHQLRDSRRLDHSTAP